MAGVSHCAGCGRPLDTYTGGNTHSPGYVPNYLVQSILVTICCCVPFGIVAIVYAAQVNGKLAAGDINGALAASQQAKTWCWAGFIIGLISGFLGTLAGLAGI